eukprot:671202-Karenia_brevis.AAC.1
MLTNTAPHARGESVLIHRGAVPKYAFSPEALNAACMQEPQQLKRPPKIINLCEGVGGVRQQGPYPAMAW